MKRLSTSLQGFNSFFHLQDGRYVVLIAWLFRQRHSSANRYWARNSIVSFQRL